MDDYSTHGSDEIIKNYVIAQFYYDQIQNHLNVKAIPKYIKGNVPKEDIMKYYYYLPKKGWNIFRVDLAIKGIVILEIIYKLVI